MSRSAANWDKSKQRDGGNWSGYQGAGAAGGGWGEFVNVPLSDQDTARVKQWSPDEPSMSQVFDALVEADYQVQVKWDAKYKCFSCILKPLGEAHTNAGLLLSGRGSTALKAIRQAAYKSIVLCDGVWGSYTDKHDKFSIDD